MPTGFTADVGEGKITTLKEFALHCARGMGACISMRDEPWDAPIPERFEPSLSYYQTKLDEARKRLAELEAMSEADLNEAAQADFKERMASYQKYERDKDLERQRYQTMLASVREWTTDAEGIREFMIEQLEMSIDNYKSTAPQFVPPEEWKGDQVKAALRAISYSEEEIEKERHRTEMRNLWLAALRRSLP